MTLGLGLWGEVIFYMNSLLDLRSDSKRPVHRCVGLGKTSARLLAGNDAHAGAGGLLSRQHT